MIPADTPAVFIVDDDASVRRLIQDLLSSVVSRSEAFASPQAPQVPRSANVEPFVSVA